jgi:hypothetical protein
VKKAALREAERGQKRERERDEDSALTRKSGIHAARPRIW